MHLDQVKVFGIVLSLTKPLLYTFIIKMISTLNLHNLDRLQPLGPSIPQVYQSLPQDTEGQGLFSKEHLRCNWTIWFLLSYHGMET